MTAVTEDAAVK